MTASAHFSARVTSASPFRRARVAELQLQVGALFIVTKHFICFATNCRLFSSCEQPRVIIITTTIS